MTCYHPLTGYYSKEVGSSGKRGITFDRNASFSGVPIRLPCGQCIGCRLDRSLQWGIRCMHEKQLHSESCFLTLTYNNEHLPEGNTLVLSDHQKFMKRFRKRFGKRVRFFMCGEYGAREKRPHYHYLIFNRDMPDRKFWKFNKRGERLYTSKVLTELWPYGFNVVGDVTLESCCYVARYICDKITGDMAIEHYRNVTGDGVLVDRLPEFTCQSRRPGLASDWYKKFGAHSHESGDFVVLDGRRVRVPRFYDNMYELLDTAGLNAIKKRRMRKAIKHLRNNRRDRLRIREVIAIRKLQMKGKEL